MFRTDFNEISDDDFVKVVRPHDKEIDKYIRDNILYEFIAFYLARGYELNALWQGSLEAHANSAIESMSGIQFRSNYDYKRLKKVLKDKYGYLIVNDNPLDLKKIG